MKRNNLLLLGMSILFAAAAFVVTIGAGPQSSAPKDPHLSGLLGLTDTQIKAIDRADPDFDRQAADLAKRLSDARGELARVLEDGDATDAQVLEAVEATIEAHNALERRVARHILMVREHLEPQQRTRLMGLCAEGVRAGQQHRYRHGQNAEGGNDSTEGGGNGWRSGGEGRGGYRGGRGTE
jgi:hypothetical protein